MLKIYKKTIENWNERMKGRISLKNWIWQGLGLHLGGVWDALGRLLGASWRSGASLGRLLIVFSGVGNPAFHKHWPNMASKRPFEPIWGRVWEALEGFGVLLGRFFPSLGRLLVVWGLS